ncbi:glycosyltransferase [Rugamonas sp. CCM 8940]|uniref:glycosyltransferase n=1 Tax=Rugamonas sp. CCM 8940 TaxID=2765359 RepID=UPI0018F649FD|nr:glycosyltransferase [Rugamonas sp. CCM 8940]MBJ7309469.1 hypothetical protein [Rugamonas sp. CCM 8940]
MMNFDLEYEVLIKDLKSAFMACKQWEAFCRQDPQVQREHALRLRILEEGYRRRLAELRSLVKENFARFDARNMSSLTGIPTQSLAADELLIHRIWMGGGLPALARESVCQWEAAITEVGAVNEQEYRLALWVWDAEQLAHDPAFRPSRGGPRQVIGSYVVGRNILTVHGLRALAQQCSGGAIELLEQLHDKRYFVNLADYFRLLILREFGGIYLDADTMPYRFATALLAKPEVPDYVNFEVDPVSGQISANFVSWLNLFSDENGLLIAKRGNSALKQIVEQMNANLALMDDSVPDKGDGSDAPARYAGRLHDATYGAWHRHLGRTFLSHHEMAQCHAILHDGKVESLISGLAGMRLRVDAISNAAMPLSAAEERSYQRCVDALEQLDWKLDRAVDLERVADVTWVREVPRMAYAPQLRAQPESCNYYSFLSQDASLDRVNSLFAAYLMSKNSERIRRGDFWCKTRGAEPLEHAAPRRARHSRVELYEPS